MASLNTLSVMRHRHLCPCLSTMPKAIPSNSISNPSFKRDKGISCSSGSAVTHNGGNRLFDFVRDRSCHGNHLVHARDARKLGSRLSERVLSLLFFRNIESYPKRELCAGFSPDF